MSLILALDASTEVCSVAVNRITHASKNEEVSEPRIFSRYCDTPKSHSKVLLTLIDDVLQEAELALTDLDALAVTRGPGSFTGIRIGLGIIQGLAYGAKLPVIGVNTLEVMAQQWAITLAGRECSTNKQAVVVPALDARMNEVYWSAYQVTDEGCNEVLSASVSSPEDCVQTLNEKLATDTIIALGHGWGVDELQALQVKQRNIDFKPQAEGVLSLALKSSMHVNDKMSYSLSTIEPLYLRNEISWQKRQRIR